MSLVWPYRIDPRLTSMPQLVLILGKPSRQPESIMLFRSFSFSGESSAVYSKRMTTLVAIVDKMLLRALTKTVPTKELSGMKAYVPDPSAANSSSRALSRLYPNPNVLMAHLRLPVLSL